MNEKEHLYNLLKEVFFILDSGDRILFSGFDLSPSRYYALYHLADTPGLTFSQLSERLFCDKSNVTRIFRVLEENGLVKRINHESDGRASRAYLTATGKALLSEVSQVHRQFNQRRLSCLSNQQRTKLMDSLTILSQELGALDIQISE
jgi:DNA-binding MarR family transcriptional regulator